MLDARQMVGDPDDRLVLEDVENRIQQVLLRNRIQTDRWLVQDNDWRILQEDSRQRQALSFTAREAAPRLLDLGVIALRQVAYHFIQLNRLNRRLDLLIRRV